MYIYLCEKVQNTVCFIYMVCSHIQVLLPQYAYVITWPCAVVSPSDVQNCGNLRDLQCESILQRAISEGTTQREWNPLQEQNELLRMKGTALYERHDVPPGIYMTNSRHRALWTARSRSGVRAARTWLLQPNAASVCYWRFFWREQSGDRRNFGESSCNSGDRTGQMAQHLMFMMMMMCYWRTIHCYTVVVFSCLNLHGCFMYNYMASSSWVTDCRSVVSRRPFLLLLQSIISHLWLCICGGTGNVCDVTFASHSLFSYCLGWRGF